MKKAGKVFIYIGIAIIPLFVLFTLIVALATQTSLNSSDMGMFLGIFGGIALVTVGILISIGIILSFLGRRNNKKI